jgi:beta-galactosidase
MPRTIIPLNYNWKYADSFREAYLSPEYDDTCFKTVTIPHTNIEVPYNYFDEKMSQFISCYRNTFQLPETDQAKNILLDFEGVMTYAEVYLNGEYIGSHKGGYTPFTVDLTSKVHFDRPNVLVVKVDSTERPDIPPFGGAIDYLTFGGIYREVRLRIVAGVYLDRVFVRPREVLQERKQVDYSIFLTNTLTVSQTVALTASIKDREAPIGTTTAQITIEARTTAKFDFQIADLAGVNLWDIDDPNLYTFEVTLTSANQAIQDTYMTRFGFRTAELTSKGFWLNGRKVKLRGLNRHQTFPYVGQAMPARAQRKDADILKQELHLNLVRTSHYPQSTHFLDRCDEIGLLVLEEIPGWQHIGDAAWKQAACENVREMIQRDWNHPSIILWDVRINESQDDHDFYLETNRIAHELDQTRQTCGVRNIPHSEFLEDVFTMNDFSHNGGELVLKDQRANTGLDHLVPYLVTENNGHMYPTKRFDQEERLIEQALRHTRIHNRAGADETMCGALSWCAFDYNTHYNFGSGDRICYHGVMDMFRLPKMAAHFYRSQVSPDKEVVLEPATLWTRGERSIGGLIPLTVFTNCTYVECYYGAKLLGTSYPDRQTYPGLEYPPVLINVPVEGLATCAWEDGRFVGYVNDKPVIIKQFVKDPVPTQLIALADDAALHADGIDVTRIVFKMVDQVGNVTPYVHDFLKLSLTGPGDIIGPHEVSLIGGCIAVWVKAQMTAGVITLSAVSSRLWANDVMIQVTKPAT